MRFKTEAKGVAVRGSATGEGPVRGLRHGALRVCLAAVAIVVAAVPAATGASAADYTKNYSISGQTGYGGGGKSYGEFYFPALDRNEVRWTGALLDTCPGDSKGVKLRLRIRKVNGTLAVRDVLQYPWTCGSGWKVVNYPISFTVNAHIKEVRAELWATEGGVPVRRFATSYWKDNPNT